MSFGARLRAERERQQVSLETIAERTKIRRQLLDALERDDVSQWPSGIFRRSYFRAYAAAIGLDPEEAVREFLTHHPDPVETEAAVLDALAESNGTNRRPRLRFQYLIESAIGSLSGSIFPNAQKVESTPATSPVVATSSLATTRPLNTTSACETTDSLETTSPVEALSLDTMSSPDAMSPVDAAGFLEATGSIDDTPGAIEISVTEMAVAPLEAETAEAADDGTVDLEKPDPVPAQPSRSIDLFAMARLCTGLAQAKTAADIELLVADAAAILHAEGVLVWLWNHEDGQLWPSLSHGYSRDLLAQLPAIRHDAGNAIAAAFRSSTTQVVNGHGTATGAVVVPILTPAGCSGVLALECAAGGEADEAIQALAGIFAAQLSMLTDTAPLARVAVA